MSSSKKEHTNIISVNDLPMNPVIQSTTNMTYNAAAAAVKKVDDQHASSSICCTCCQEEDDEHNDAAQFCQDCQLPLCDAHAALHQKAKNHSLVPVDQTAKDQKYDSLEHKGIDRVEEESIRMRNNEQSLSNVLQKHICCVCHNQLSKTYQKKH
jgi:hypothetical protein